jgi:hypothetical protein
MELTAFTSRLGESQGRLKPTSASPAGGEWVFVLGDEDAGRLYELAAGDHAELSQDVDVTDANLFRADLRLRVPCDLPETLAWEAQLRVDGATVASARCKPGRERHLTDLAANLSKLAGVHTLGVRLALVEV